MKSSDILPIIAICVSILTFGASGLLSYYLAKKYGDVAAGKATRKHWQEQAAKARIVALQSLLNEVDMIRSLAHHNSEQTVDPSISIHSVVRMPVVAFETAFLSGKSALLEKLEGGPGFGILASVTDYLKEAYSINALVDLYLGLVRGTSTTENHRRNYVIREIAGRCGGLSEILNRLEENLRREAGLE